MNNLLPVPLFYVGPNPNLTNQLIANLSKSAYISVQAFPTGGQSGFSVKSMNFGLV